MAQNKGILAPLFHFLILLKSDTLKLMNEAPKTALIYKNAGETPLEALERFRAEKIQAGQAEQVKTAVGVLDEKLVKYYTDVPMTYAGRLDPLAEGALLILVGEECKNKEKYLGLDKEYEVEILFGISTDTHDVLGMVDGINEKNAMILPNEIDLSKYIGKFAQKYPPYSSKTVNGKQLHELARADELPAEMPEKEVEIYSIDILGDNKISAKDLESRIISAVDLVKGDFRQNEITKKWGEVLFDVKNATMSDREFTVLKIRVKCSSGTYMRSLADRIGKDLGTFALAFSIKRTKIGKYSV